jgi:hypothetical protein
MHDGVGGNVPESVTWKRVSLKEIASAAAAVARTPSEKARIA